MGKRGAGRAHGRVLLHDTVAEKLRRDIVSGFYPRGTYLPSEAALGARFQVSRVTVRKALASLTALGLTRPEAGIGHRVGGQLVTGQGDESNLVAVLAPYAEGNPYFAELAGGLERTLAEADLHLAVYSTDCHGEMTCEQVMAAQVGRLLRLRPRATVVCGQRRQQHDAQLRRLQQAGIAVVEVGEGSADGSSESVGTDDRLASMAVTEWLWRWGGGPVALVVGPETAPNLEARLEGYRLALESHGVPPGAAASFALGTAGEQDGLFQRLAGAHEGGRMALLCPGVESLACLARAAADLAQTRVFGREVAVGCVVSPPWLGVETSIPVVAARWPAGRMGESVGRLIMGQSNGEGRLRRQVLLAPQLVVDEAYRQEGPRPLREEARREPDV
jgi:DNA-binding LacI/PurR family transcriptional regulator